MCLSIPGKIIAVSGKSAIADFSGTNREINIEFVDVKKDDYVLVYSGHAIEKISKKRALEIIRGFKE